jgi:Kelch motif protein
MPRPFGFALAALAAVGLAAALGSLDAGADEAEAAPWTYAKPMSMRRSYIAAAELGGKIYAAGGMVGGNGRRLAIFQRFDPKANRWETLRPLPEAIRAAAGAASAGTFYVVGGDTEEGDGTQVYGYDIAANTWTQRAALPAPRFNHSAVALGGRIYVIGGYMDGRERRDVFVYEPEDNRWDRAAPLPLPTHVFGAVAFRGEIWIIGGRRGEKVLREISIYDPARNRWRAGPILPKPMELLGAAVVGDEIHAIWESTYQIYDADTGTWREGPRSLTTRHGLNTFYVEGLLFTIGGCTTQLRDSNVVEKRPVR